MPPTPITTGPWIGIPDPPFGLTETAPARPNPWNSVVAGYYYVDGDAGSDTANPNGHPGAPRKTIPRALAAGSYVEVHGTDAFEYTNPNQIQPSGTSGSPVFIRGQDTNTRPTFTGQMDVLGSYCIVEYCNWVSTDSDGVSLRQGDHCVLRHCDIQGDDDSGGSSIANDGSSAGSPQYHVFWDCTIHDTGDWITGTEEDGDFHGITIAQGVHHCWVLGCEFYHCAGDGVQINAGTDNVPDTHHIYLAGNVAHDNRQTGFWCKQCTDVVISQNVCYSLAPSIDGLANGAAMGGQYAPNRVWFLFNEIYDCDFGIQISSDLSSHGANDAIYYIGNVIHDLTDHNGSFSATNVFTDAAISIRGSEHHFILNNTIYNTGCHGITFPGPGLQPYIYGNILSVIHTSGRHLFLEHQSTVDELQGNANVFTPNLRFNLAGVTGTISAPDLSGTDRVVASAGFVNAAAGDFRLAAGSAALECEATDYTSVYDAFFTIHGVSIQVDFDNVARPQFTFWDAGAFENAADAPPDPPPPHGGILAPGVNFMPYLEVNGNPSWHQALLDGILGIHTSQPTGGNGLNTFIGKGTGTTTLTSDTPPHDGSYNTGVGAQVLDALTNGQGNSVVGAGSAGSLTTGDENNILGAFSQVLNVGGIRNNSVGTKALRNVTGDDNNAIGGGAGLAITSGSRNLLWGTNAGNGGTPSGDTGAFALLTGSNNIFLGINAGMGDTNQISNAIVIGSSAASTASNSVTIGSSAMTRATIYGTPTNALVTGTLSNPGAGTTSLTGVHVGAGLTFTPTVTGRALILWNVSAANSSTGGAFLAVRYGTGTPPTLGDASTGTTIGSAPSWGAGVSGGSTRQTLVVQGVITNLTRGTTYWVDAVQGAVSTGTATFTQMAATIMEI